MPISILAVAGSVIGIALEEEIYREETANWAAQSVGQDIANLAVYPLLLVLAYAAARGSLRAYLAWVGLLVYSAYTYAIYVFDVHFGPLFLVWVAVFGLSIWALVRGLASIDPVRVAASFSDRTPIRSTAALLLGVGVGFYLLWLSEIIPPAIQGTVPEALDEAGLPTNPVHVLDLALFLPAVMLGGLMLLRGRAWGYTLAPALLAAMVSLAVGIVSLMGVLAARDLGATPGVGLAIGILVAIELVVVIRFLGAIRRDADLPSVMRPLEARPAWLARLDSNQD